MIRLQIRVSSHEASTHSPPLDAASLGQAGGARNCSEARRFLIILPRQLGDILLGLPLAHALKTQYPDAQISWYAHPMGRLLLHEHPWVDELLCYPVSARPDAKLRKDGARWGLVRRLVEAWRVVVAEVSFVRDLRARRFDAVIDAMCNPRTALTAWLTGAAVRISFRTRFPRTLAFTHLLPRARLSDGYVAKARLSLLEPLGLADSSDFHALLPCGADGRARVDAFMLEHGLAEGRFIVCAPAHRHAVRKWPAEKFAALAKRLGTGHGLRLVWLWGPGEHAEVLALQNLAPAQGIVPPLLTLKETAYLAGRALCFVGNSNGLSHVCVAGGARSVQIHGPTSPINWTYPDPARHAGVQRDRGCVRCEKNTCALARRECLEDLTVDQVMAAVEKICGLEPANENMETPLAQPNPGVKIRG